MSSFENLRIVDNFYQTSLYFPMPTVIISTLCEDGTTTLGPYSLVQPYYVAGKDYYAMLLCCRNSSNTAQNILRNGKCALNFIDDKPKTFKEAVKLSWPGEQSWHHWGGDCRNICKKTTFSGCTRGSPCAAGRPFPQWQRGPHASGSSRGNRW